MTDPNKQNQTTHQANDQADDHIDEITGIETTGHVWDGLRELNNPLPRWWLWVMYATIAWSLVYFVLYPSWPVPGGHTEGTKGYTQYKELEASQAEIRERRARYLARFEQASYEEIASDKELYAFAFRGGESAFKDNCATCHGSGAVGAVGYPSLVDDAWLWGGDIAAIETTIRYGIRSTHDDSRFNDMPAFGEFMSPDDIQNVTSHVLALGKGNADMTSEGATLFADNCAACHSEDGTGIREMGAPNLVDAIWLYGGSRAEVARTVTYSRGGVMPHWTGRLSENTIRALAFYVHELGGGEDQLNAQTRASRADAKAVALGANDAEDSLAKEDAASDD